MKKLKAVAACGFVAATSAQSVLAHAGHDHGHWSSTFIHLGLAASIGVAVWLLYRLIKRSGRTSQK